MRETPRSRCCRHRTAAVEPVGGRHAYQISFGYRRRRNLYGLRHRRSRIGRRKALQGALHALRSDRWRSQNGLKLICRGSRRQSRPRSFPIAICASTARLVGLECMITHQGRQDRAHLHGRPREIRSKSATATRKTDFVTTPNIRRPSCWCPRYLRKGVSRTRACRMVRSARPCRTMTSARLARLFKKGRCRDSRHFLRLVGAQSRA